MILVDTSVWIDHLRYGDANLVGLLDLGLVATHDFVIGEIACGNPKNRHDILLSLDRLPKCEPATHQEVMYLIDRHKLMGRGINYIDASLLAAALLGQVQLWTRDKRMLATAEDLKCAYSP